MARFSFTQTQSQLSIANLRANPRVAYERVLWILFVCLLCVVAFIPGRIDYADWQLVSYALYIIALLSLPLARGRLRHLSRRDTLGYFLLVVLMAFWSVWPSILPLESSFHTKIYPIEDRPDWFDPLFYWSVTPELTKSVFYREVMVVAVVICTLVLCSSRRRLALLLWTMLAISLVHSFIAYIAWSAGTHLVSINELDGHYSAMRGLFVNRNHFANFILLTSLGAWVGLIYGQFRLSGRSLRQRAMHVVLSRQLIFFLALVIVYFCLLMSESRAGFGGGLLLIALLAWRIQQKLAVSKSRLKLVTFVAVLGLIGLSLMLIYSEQLASRVFSGDTLLGERIPQWRITLEAILAQPVVGYGAGSYALVFEYFRVGTELRDVIFDQAHNDWLHLTLEQGVVGLLISVGIFSLAFKRLNAYVSQTRSRYRLSLLVSIFAVICVVVLQSLVDFNTQIVRIRLFLFVVLTLIFVLSQYDRRKPKSLD